MMGLICRWTQAVMLVQSAHIIVLSLTWQFPFVAEVTCARAGNEFWKGFGSLWGSAAVHHMLSGSSLLWMLAGLFQGRQGQINLSKTTQRSLPHRAPTPSCHHSPLICLIWSCWTSSSSNTESLNQSNQPICCWAPLHCIYPPHLLFPSFQLPPALSLNISQGGKRRKRWKWKPQASLFPQRAVKI